LGKISALLFHQQDNKDFGNSRNVAIVAILSVLVLISPMIAGFIDIILNFTRLMLGSLIIYLFIAVLLSFQTRKNLLCKYCMQGKLGCPAYEGMKGTDKKELPMVN
jgi:MFS-type transporter involved in bile tolerance (Atg22 family)